MTDTSIADRQELLWLLSRLTWPSILARERACIGLATLLLHPQLGDIACSTLLDWIARQRLESIAAIGILPFLRAQIQNSGYRAPCTKLTHAIHVPSILSWLLLNELDSQQDLPLAEVWKHEATAPKDFSPLPFFAKYANNFLPPIYTDYVSTIERHERIPLTKQWAFEWQGLLSELGIQPNRRELDTWYRVLPSNEHYAGVDTMMSEIYRSAFLRGLAWAKHQGLTIDIVDFFAVRTCPVDLGLWSVSPQPKPSWWPQLKQPAGQFDTNTAHVWQQVQFLWEQHQGNLSDNGTIVEASGIIYFGESLYNLEIFGVFQRPIGPIAPDLDDVVTWYSESRDNEGEVLSIDQASPLHFGGGVAAQPKAILESHFADWIVTPAARLNVSHQTVPRWQMWRMQRGIWLPAPCLSELPLTIACEQDAIVIRNNEREVGQWIDWADGLEETQIEGIPFKSGQMLQVNSAIIEQFAQRNTMNFCWLCQLTSYSNGKSHRDAESFSEQRIFGASHIFRL